MKKLKDMPVKKLGMVILVLAIVLILFMSTRFINSEYLSSPIDSSGNNVQNVSTISNDKVNITEEDRKFQDWTNLLSGHMKSDLYCIAESAKKKNLTDLEICGRILKENSNKSIGEISKFNTSPSFEMTVSEYKKSLELYYLGGKNLEIGAKNYDTDLMVNATIYIDQGKKKMTNAHYLITLVS